MIKSPKGNRTDVSGVAFQKTSGAAQPSYL